MSFKHRQWTDDEYKFGVQAEKPSEPAPKRVIKKPAAATRLRSRTPPPRTASPPFLDTGPTIVTVDDCVGMNSVAHALRGLGCNHKCLAVSDIDPIVQAFWFANFADGQCRFFPDLTKRDKAWLVAQGEIDVYTAGFPCQPFSASGLHGGADDPRAACIAHIISYIQSGMPRTFILENVEGLVTSHAETLTWILKKLKGAASGAYFVDA
eukprot:1391589-Pyramimonas_sp.AAC.1